MGWLIVLVLVFVVFVVISKAKAKQQSADPAIPLPYCTRLLVTQNEQPLFWRLQESLPDHVILAQVQLSRLIDVKSGVEKSQSWRNRIDRKSLDFVVCRRDFSVVTVIELDDSSHDRASRRKKDADKDAALAAAGVQIIRWRHTPSAEEVRQAVLGATKAPIVAAR